MYILENKQFLFKLSTGEVWRFFFNDRAGLCFSILNKKKIWSEPILLQKDLRPSFFVDVDLEDRFHIAFQNTQGNIFYSVMTNGTVKTIPILAGRSPSQYNKHIIFVMGKSETHFLYVLDYNGSTILSHQMLVSGQVKPPKVIDYINADQEKPYAVAVDKMNNIYAFYRLSDEKHMQIGCKKYLHTLGVWGDFTPITRKSLNIEHPVVVVDNIGVMHLCYHRCSGKKYELVYQRKVDDKEIWTSENVIYSMVYPFTNYSIVIINQKIIIYWVKDDLIYYAVSNDGGDTFISPDKYTIFGNRQLICMSYKSNNIYDSEKIIVPTVPGTLADGFKMAFVDIPKGDISNMPQKDFNAVITDELKGFKKNIDEVKEAYQTISNAITDLRTMYEGLYMEITKLSIRSSMVSSGGTINKEFSLDDDNEIPEEWYKFSMQPKYKLSRATGKIYRRRVKTITRNHRA